MIIGMKCLNESKVAKRCIEDFHDEDFVDKIIVIDGDSSDFTPYIVRRFPKVECHVHKWLPDYHYMECIQSNIVLSYIPNGEVFFILDFDERMSPDLKETLRQINKGTIFIPDKTVIHFPRRTFEVFRHDDSPYAILGEDGWPIVSHQIGQYPDVQGRLMRKFPEFHWINSPHHVPCGHTAEQTMAGDILHFNKDDLRDRDRIESQWAFNQVRRRELGLTADRFETRVRDEISDAFESEYWKR